MQEKVKTEKRVLPTHTLRVCIDSYTGDISGRLYSRMCGTPIRFEACSGLLLQADALFDRCRYPQSFQEKRSFGKTKRSYGYDSKPKEELSEDEICRQNGLFATFQIIVQSRNRAGWQGVLLREDGSTVAKFQSELELLDKLLEELQREPGKDPPDVKNENNAEAIRQEQHK